MEDICGVCSAAAHGFFPHSPVSICSGSGIIMGFKAFFPISAGESSGCAVSGCAGRHWAVPTECTGKHFQISPPSKFAVVVPPWFCVGGNGAYLRAGAPWVLGAPPGVFSLEPLERCLIEILSLPGIILREADECCGKRFSYSLETFSIQKLV